MARIRTIKPSAFSSESLARVTVQARWTFAGLWTYVDDAGRGRANPKLIKAHVWPLDEDVTSADVDGMLDELEREGMIRRYDADGSTLFEVVNWHHQRINRPSPSDLPAPSADAPRTTPPTPITDDSVKPHDTSDDTSRQERKGKEGKGEEGMNARASARGSRIPEDWRPTDEDIVWQRTQGIDDLLARREYPKFVDYWRAKAGRDATKLDWSATWRNWLRRASESAAPPRRGLSKSDMERAALDPLWAARQ